MTNKIKTWTPKKPATAAILAGATLLTQASCGRKQQEPAAPAAVVHVPAAPAPIRLPLGDLCKDLAVSSHDEELRNMVTNDPRYEPRKAALLAAVDAKYAGKRLILTNASVGHHGAERQRDGQLWARFSDMTVTDRARRNQSAAEIKNPTGAPLHEWMNCMEVTLAGDWTHVPSSDPRNFASHTYYTAPGRPTVEIIADDETDHGELECTYNIPEFQPKIAGLAYVNPTFTDCVYRPGPESLAARRLDWQAEQKKPHATRR